MRLLSYSAFNEQGRETTDRKRDVPLEQILELLLWLKGRSDEEGTQEVRNVFHAFGLSYIAYMQRN